MSKKLIIMITLVLQIVSSSNFAVQLFTLEGTTGAGKSTLLKLLAEEMEDIVPIYEPVDQIQDVGGHGNLLDLFYQDNQRWTYLFQTYAFFLRDELNTDAKRMTNDKTLLGDRSVFSTFYVFGKMLHQGNIFTCMEWHIYKRWFDYALERSTVLPAGFIYLRTTPDVCYSRIKKRNRTEEQAAPLDYYLQEYNFHEKWLIEKNEIEHECLKKIPVLVLDGNVDFLTDETIRKSMAQQIREFIVNVSNRES